MTQKEKLIELLETIPHAQRLYPDLYVDMLIENGVRVVVQCKDCKYAYQSEDAFDWDGETPLCECVNSNMVNRWHEYCSWGDERKQPMEKCLTCKNSVRGRCQFLLECNYEPLNASEIAKQICDECGIAWDENATEPTLNGKPVTEQEVDYGTTL